MRAQDSDPRLEGEVLKNQLHEGLLNYARIAATAGPLVLVYDDLHWSDPASVDLIRNLFQLVEQSPVLILCAFRPHRQAPCWRLKKYARANYPHSYTEIMLGSLQADESDRLVSSLLANADPETELRDLIWRKAEGNPLYVEEVIRELQDKGVLVRDKVDGAEVGPWHSAACLASLPRAMCDRAWSGVSLRLWARALLP